ncbi:MocR-like pyridoxine biosynthesis transcription factor PdxR [Pyxidicoccus xibeiensis]|uniref:MocR-like pyridoxine biosynthesis transcription factor PdxR n=1 Tax=Pyxidicoccus xibeiensis TaxID=2906759 RepID=UPI0020A81865|nr:PLP-dependent aminotransferase family protein [Pyxidicoccus xibeiensis]MCP3139944.1 PLP-dependent aminotransferase family protein [Pyxidicoccus xibeiensis]
MEPVFPFALELPTRGQGRRTQALHRQLREAILDGRYPAGAPLPATRQVAAALGVARNTVVTAYDLLMAEGYVLPRRGATAVVADLAARRPARGTPRAPGRDATRISPSWRTAPFLGPSAPADLPPRSFRVGVPEHRHFPHDTWRRLSARSLRAWAKAPFTYPPTEGLPELREAIAQHVAFSRAVVCTRDDVIVTSGAQQAFDLLARLLVTPGETRVAVEEPGYPRLRAAFAAAGARQVPVPVDDEGLRVDRLPGDVRVVSVTPSHQSPTGVALSLSRRRALLDFARARDAVVIEDDYDGEFRFAARPLDALQTLDRDARVFYVGTFSKSLFPGVRIGFVIAPRWARDALLAIKQCSDAHCDAVAQATLAAFIRDGHLARHVRRMRPIYAERRTALLAGLRRHLADWLEPIPSEAGLHLAARVLQPEHAATLFATARHYAPGVQSITEYSLTPPEQPALSFGYGVMEAEEITSALRRWGGALARR